jgi:hypothetical protein
MKFFKIEHDGTLVVAWKDCYQHPDMQTIGKVQLGQMIVVMNNNEFQHFKQRML